MNDNIITYHLQDNFRHRLISNIHNMPVDVDSEGRATISMTHDKKGYLKKIGTIDTIEEKVGFINSRDKVYIEPDTDQFNDFFLIVPFGVKIVEDTKENFAAGDYISDGETVYRLYGWDKINGGSEIYFDFLDGEGSRQLRYNDDKSQVSNYF